MFIDSVFDTAPDCATLYVFESPVTPNVKLWVPLPDCDAVTLLLLPVNVIVCVPLLLLWFVVTVLLLPVIVNVFVIVLPTIVVPIVLLSPVTVCVIVESEHVALLLPHVKVAVLPSPV